MILKTGVWQLHLPELTMSLSYKEVITVNQEQESNNSSRRNFLKCLAWSGSGIVWAVSSGGLLSACGDLTNTPTSQAESFSFIQLSDTHIGFNGDGINTDVVGCLY
jgi:hypothetical protein